MGAFSKCLCVYGSSRRAKGRIHWKREARPLALQECYNGSSASPIIELRIIS